MEDIKMSTKEQMEKEIADWNKANPRNHTLLNEETILNDRKVVELRFIRSRTKEFLMGISTLARLETVKDFLRYDMTGKPRVPNIYGMTCTGADAKVHKDCRDIVLKNVELDGIVSNVHCKEINKNAIVYIDLNFAQKLITEQKDKKTQDEMKQRLQSAINLKTRASYEKK
jgi:hypothetical protein